MRPRALALAATAALAIASCGDGECDRYFGECHHLCTQWSTTSAALGCDFTGEDYYCRQQGSGDTCASPRVTECEQAIAAADTCPLLDTVAYCYFLCPSDDLD